MRVELEEIKAALAALPGIAHGVVVARTRMTTDTDTRLVAYVVPSDLSMTSLEGETIALEGVLDLEAVRSGLRQVLPEYMVPSSYVGLRRLPLTSSGKLDRRALPSVEGEVATAEYVAPRDEVEALVAGVFARVLGVERVGVRDGFFDLGGHSLLAVRVVSGLAEATGKELAVRAVFEHPTVEGLARVLSALSADSELAAIVPADRSGALPLSLPAGASLVPVAPGDGGGRCLQHHGGAAVVGGAGRCGAARGAGRACGASREPADAGLGGGRTSCPGD